MTEAKRPTLNAIILAVSREVRYASWENKPRLLRALEILNEIDRAGKNGRAFIAAASQRPNIHNDECFAIIKALQECERRAFIDMDAKALEAAQITVSIVYADLPGFEVLTGRAPKYRRRSAA